MTLSLDDVRNKRFRIARKSGYEVLEVDEFVDGVEEAFAQLIEENQNLKKQVESLRTATPDPAAESGDRAVPARETIVVTTAQEASSAVVRLVQLSTEQAERLLSEATEEAGRLRKEAQNSADELAEGARTQAERVEAEARANAERLESEAKSQAEEVNRAIEARRAEEFGQLEHQRVEFASAVEALRQFEAAYRANLVGHLRSQLEELESGAAQPADVPELARAEATGDSAATGAAAQDAQAGAAESAPKGRDGSAPNEPPRSDTPRLDALLGDQH